MRTKTHNLPTVPLVLLGLAAFLVQAQTEVSAAEPPNSRKPAGEAELRYWLQNMVWHHRFTAEEITAATGLSAGEVAAALKKFAITSAGKPKRPAGAPLLVLPYPGGRHPRIGFLDGAVRPQRETKVSVFTPWDDASYVVADVPEAIWSNLGLLYLAHTHVPTVWTKQGVELEPLEWNRRADGTLDIERQLPNGVRFGCKVAPAAGAVRMELWLTNGTKDTLTDLRVQNCVMLEGAAGFQEQTDKNKVFASPYAACRSADGNRWIITAWEPCHRAWGNPKCPCLHSDPKFPDCPPGETRRLKGWLSFYEGTDIQAEIRRIESTGWRTEAQPPRPKRPPNLLWIVGENIALDLGCYGEKRVRTPNLDRLAAEGVRYTRAFATAPVCSASRSAFMTGMYQTSIGAHHARSHRDDGFQLPAGVRPLTHWLRDAGYFSANVKTIDGQVVGTGKVDLNFTWEGKLFDSDSWADLKARQPFYAQVNTPEVEYDIYDRKSATKERVEWVGEREHPQVATPENVTPPPYYPDHPVTRQEWARYLNSVSGMDRRVGVVLEKLKADGLLEDTVVIFFADNGRLEARGIHWCYDCGLHVPLIIRWPKNYPSPPLYRPGTVDERVVSLLDLTATTLSFARVGKPAGMQSRVFFGHNTEPTPRLYAFAARDRIDESVQRIRSVHDRRFHYIRNYMPERPFTALNRYKEKCFLVMPLMRQLHAEGKLTPVQAALMAPRLPAEELYDLKADPHEVRNLVGSATPAHQDALKRLRAELDRWVAETKDQGAVPEPPEVVAPFEKEMHDWFGTPEWARRGQ